MARIIARVPRKIAWSFSDRLRLYLGSENEASLAAPTPPGGTLVDTQPAWGDGDAQSDLTYGWGEGEYGYGEYGIHEAPRAVLQADYTSVDKCATLPVGVVVVDELGNASAVFETVVQLHDPPQGARNLQVSPTDEQLEALLTWDASPDV